MSAVALVASAPGASLAKDPSPPRSVAGVPPALPDADLATALFQAQVLSRRIQSRTALATAESAQSNREQAISEARAELQRAAEEQKAAESKGKWINALRTVGTVAAVVVAAASVVFSAGMSAPAAVALVGVALSVSSPYVAEWTGSKELGLGLALAGAAMSLGAGIYSAAATAATTTLTTSQQVVIVGGKVASASAEVSAGAATIARGRNEAAALEARSASQMKRAAAEREQVAIDEAVATLAAIEASARRAIVSILAVGSTVSQARGAIIMNTGRV